MIVIYDPASRMPRYTVDEPYPPEALTFYESLASDTDAVAVVPQADIFGKCVDVENSVLIDRPDMALTHEVVGNTVTISGLIADSEIWVDGLGPYETGSNTSEAVELATPGIYSITVTKLPYVETTFTVAYE